MKVCKKCNIEKEDNDYHFSGSGERRGVCKVCRSCKIHYYKHSSLDASISRSINVSIKRNKVGYIWERTINITKSTLMSHLESLFSEEMSWENYGEIWVIDKIIPTKLYKYSDIINGEFRKAWNLKNFRPLLTTEKKKKKRGLDMMLVELYSLYDILPIGNFLDKS